MSHERLTRGQSDAVKAKTHEVLSGLMARDPKKYRGTVSGLKRSILLFIAVDRGNIWKARKRSELFRIYYTDQREADDFGDGDAVLPAGLKASSYIKDKMQRLNGIPPQESPDIMDLMYQKCDSLAGDLGFSIKEETRSIYGSILFDAERREYFLETGKFKLHSAADLREHFIQSDTLGCIGGMLSLFGDDASRALLLEPAGWAERARMTIEDLPADIRAGLINIPQEDMEKYSISQSDFDQTASLGIMIVPTSFDRLPSNIRAWVNDHAAEGLRNLNMQEKILSENTFKWIGTKVLREHYMKSTRKYFEDLIAQQSYLIKEGTRNLKRQS